MLDRLLGEIGRRFSDKSLAVTKAIQALLCPSSSNFLNFSFLQPFLAHYGDACNVTQSLLKAEMLIASDVMWNVCASKIPAVDTTSLELSDVIQILTTSSLAVKNLLKCIQIALTIPVTSASCERSFSAMKLVKNYLRNATSDQRLSDLLTLHVCYERTRAIDVDVIIDTFAEKSGRPMQFN